VIITSATIDPERFARHFGGAPVVEVSGRTHPVEVRYRPGDPEAERDQTEAIGDAVDELMGERPGDVLVFLSGEREIRDTAEALRGRLRSHVEVLPLYARQSGAEQRRIFARRDGGAGRRVVLATNVAETSLTVPGIRYVVDPGMARISRYSARLKVQRLPIEPVSQASADQRKGRCGRVAEGICIRLYAEEDFEARPRFTDPEIQRTSLAAVILQMAAAGLGDVEDFPFLDPPDRRQVRDGVLLLTELGALEEGRLTALGRRLAGLPVDPRMGRMVLEAGRLGCADEVIVIAAALSIQDPRERPADKQAQADQAHARFADESSDFMALLNLWRHLREQRGELSGSQFRKRCKAEFLHYLRVREWQDLVAQLRQAAKGAGVTPNRAPAEPPLVHQALLAGLLSHAGLKDAERREYLGARGARFALWPGSSLSRRAPGWVMVAELVETSRLWGRTAARIDPRWIEPLAGHLVKRTYDEPRWEPKRASVVATERVTLYGLPVVAGRTVPYGSIDPALARDLFIRRALVEGEWDARHAFLRGNAQVVEEVEALEHRARRRDIFAGDYAVHAFYDERIPPEVVSGAHFDRWWREERRRRPDLLSFRAEDLVDPAAGDVLDPRARPEAWKQGDEVLRLSYRFEPGAEDDGVTVHLPLKVLPALRSVGFDWLVPALRLELVTALIRSLPKELRRPLVPVPEVAAELLARLRPRAEPLLDAVARELEALRGVRVAPGTLDLARLPPHLRMSFAVEDEQGREVARGKDLEALREAVRPALQAELATATAGIERTGLRAWTLGALPREVELPGSGGALKAYPALVDEGDTVGVRILDDRVGQRAAMRAGTRRLLRLTVPSPARSVAGRLGGTAQLALAAAPHASPAAVLEDSVTAALDALIARGGGPAWDEAGFARLRAHVAGALAGTTVEIVGQVVAVLDAAQAVRRAMERPTGEALRPIRHDVARQLGGLVFPGFVAATGARRLPDVERYLRGAAVRLERLPASAATDLDRMRGVHELEAAYRARVEALAPGQAIPPALREVRWLVEELRMSHFAPALGVRGPVSSKRIRRALAEAV